MAHDVRSPHIFVDGPGNTASGDQVMDNFDAVWTTLDANRVASEGQYQTIFNAGGFAAIGGSGASTYVLYANGGLAAVGGGVASAPQMFYLDPAEHAVSGLTTKYRVRVTLATNSSATGINFTFGLYPVTSVSGGAGVVGIIAVGTVVSGSTVLFSSPVVSSGFQAVSGDFAPPTAGFFVPAVVTSGTAGANSAIGATVVLEKRHV